MWAVYCCGCTDCFLHAMFIGKNAAQKWAEENCKNPEGYVIKFFQNPSDIDVTDTGWENNV